MDLKTIQYPRHIHRDGQFQVVQSAEQCDAAMDAGWVLSPGDPARPRIVAPALATLALATSDDGPADAGAESRPRLDSTPEPDAPARKPGRLKVRK